MRDLLLTLAALDAFDVAWTDEILEEVQRNVVADHPDIDPDRFASHTLGAMRAAFPQAAGASAIVTEILDLLTVHPTMGTAVERLRDLTD